MGKKKQTTQQTQNTATTNTYGYAPGAQSADIDAVRNFKFTADPSIGYAFGSAKNKIANSFNNPMGGNYTPQMRDSILRSTLSDLAQKESQAKTEAAHGLQGQQFAQQVTTAGLTSPRFVQTGSTGTGSSSGVTTQSSDLLQQLLIGGATGAAS